MGEGIDSQGHTPHPLMKIREFDQDGISYGQPKSARRCRCPGRRYGLRILCSRPFVGFQLQLSF